ncbi:hypothetical protein ASC78_10830 [Variovorax sp. Root318D1]|nr:hypothetical protein ASC78_10830 [Variovorax sp. Root318D1]
MTANPRDHILLNQYSIRIGRANRPYLNFDCLQGDIEKHIFGNHDILDGFNISAMLSCNIMNLISRYLNVSEIIARNYSLSGQRQIASIDRPLLNAVFYYNARAIIASF